jgi:hypothetical protein
MSHRNHAKVTAWNVLNYYDHTLLDTWLYLSYSKQSPCFPCT